jgi:hypothetical protein
MLSPAVNANSIRLPISPLGIAVTEQIGHFLAHAGEIGFGETALPRYLRRHQTMQTLVAQIGIITCHYLSTRSVETAHCRTGRAWLQTGASGQHQPHQPDTQNQARQKRSISKKVKDADQVTSTKPVSASVPVTKRIAPVGMTSPSPSVVKHTAE